ncbi:hypothetical protein SDC9_146451 [bioreactor metagenome]|uniref:THUMP-like domain-containing protein n=1 Tax=bioreactor metagenome TaxID=1076179 RepID=A0A645EBP4_9ZZZZ
MPLKYIYEPNSSIMKLGLWNGLCGKYAVSKLHSNSHLFTSNECLEHFPGRAFEIVAVTSFTTKAVKQYLCNENQVNIAVRNFPYTVKDIYKKLKLNEGGNLYLFATTTLDNKLSIIITQKIKK